MNIHNLLYVPGDSQCLPVNNDETFKAHQVSCRVVVNKGWGPKMFLEPVPKGSAGFPYIFFWTIDVLAFESIHIFTLLTFTVPVLGGHEEGFYGVGFLEMYLDPHVIACHFEPFPKSMDVRYHYEDVLVVVVC